MKIPSYTGFMEVDRCPICEQQGLLGKRHSLGQCLASLDNRIEVYNLRRGLMLDLIAQRLKDREAVVEPRQPRNRAVTNNRYYRKHQDTLLAKLRAKRSKRKEATNAEQP